jgi:chemotaxis protein methyltransferase CheR
MGLSRSHFPKMISAQPRAELSREDFLRFRDLVRTEIGLVVPDVRRRDLERAVANSLADSSLDDLDQLYAQLTTGTDRRRLEAFVGELTVGETHFFRNRPQFRALEQEILPGLIAARSESRRLRIWSAGCSSGEEAYSIAILLRRLIPDLDDWNVTILATDINRGAIERGQRGVYGAWSFREVPSGIESTYFKSAQGGLEIATEVRRLVTFGYLNLVDDVYPSLHTNTTGMDLVLCRNVLIYFEDPTVKKVVAQLHQALVEGGWLAVAPAEFSQVVFKDFETCNFENTVIYRKSAPATRRAGDRRRRASDAPVEKDAVRWAGSPPPSPDTSPRRPVAEPDRRHVPRTPKRDEDLAALERRTAEASTDPRAPYLAARLLAGRLELDGAVRFVEMAIERGPLFAPAYYLKGLILLEAGDLEGALAALRRCVFSDPDFVLGHFMLAGVFARDGQSDRALKALDNASDLLRGTDARAEVPEGDGLTVGRLIELVGVQRDLITEAAGDG